MTYPLGSFKPTSTVMGPDSPYSHSYGGPSTMIDPKLPPSSNGQGSQEQLRRWKHEVLTWVKLHESWVSSNHAQGLKPEQQGFVLLRVLYGRAKDLCRNITDDVIGSVNGVSAIVDCVMQSNADSDIQYQIGIMDKIHSLYRRDGQRMTEYTSVFKSQVEKYIEVAGPLNERMNEFFALEMIRRAGLEPGLRGTVLTSALNITVQERQMTSAKAWYAAAVSNETTVSQSSVSASEPKGASGIVLKLSEIKTLVQDLPKYDGSNLQKAIDNASELSKLVADMPATAPEREMHDGPTPDDVHTIPAAIDGISNSKRATVMDQIRPLRILLDTTIAEITHSGTQFEAISSSIIQVSEDLKKLVLDLVTHSANAPQVYNAKRAALPDTAPARITISAVCAALAPLDVFSETQGSVVKTLYASPSVPYRNLKKRKGQRGAPSGQEKKYNPEFKQCDYSGCTRPNSRHTYLRCWDRQKDEKTRKGSGSSVHANAHLTPQN